MPPGRQGIDLTLRPLAFHGQDPGPRTTQGCHVDHEVRQGGECPRHDCIEGLLLQRFDTTVHRFDILQAKLMRGMLNKTDLLAVGIDEPEAPLRIQKRERQAGKTCTRSNISHGCPPHVRVNRQAVEQMMRQHLLALADRREVIGTVPALELIEQARQSLRIRLRQGDTQSGGVFHKALNHAHVVRIAQLGNP